MGFSLSLSLIESLFLVEPSKDDKLEMGVEGCEGENRKKENKKRK